MKSFPVRRPLSLLLVLLGTALWTACGSNSGGRSAEVPARGAEPAASANADRAPGFSLLDTQGKTVALADFKGQVVFIDFWATWCPPCRMSMPLVEKLHAAYQGKPVQVLGLNLDEDPDDVRKFVAKKHTAYPVLLAGNSDISSAYGVGGIPHFVLIDQEGRVAGVWPGFASEMDAEWRAAIDKLLGV